MSDMHQFAGELEVDIEFVRYEKLVNDKASAFAKVLDYIGADAGTENIDTCGDSGGQSRDGAIWI